MNISWESVAKADRANGSNEATPRLAAAGIPSALQFEENRQAMVVGLGARTGGQELCLRWDCHVRRDCPEAGVLLRVMEPLAGAERKWGRKILNSAFLPPTILLPDTCMDWTQPEARKLGECPLQTIVPIIQSRAGKGQEVDLSAETEEPMGRSHVVPQCSLWHAKMERPSLSRCS